ncbi:hypothetical protein IPH25_00285 [bacterium]|nr:MAG: hypothetical protein IPG37_02400 [bacterium]QQR61871.1 MAG: hypothetical protein IPH25_00285 [bacterium]QQR62548.1 MAG: hypothetical protein IPH67_03955 [bacterium]
MKKAYQIIFFSFLLFVGQSHCMFSNFIRAAKSSIASPKVSIGVAATKQPTDFKTNLMVPKTIKRSEHVVYKQDREGNVLPLNQKEYEKINKKVIKNYQWPTAIKNPAYNPALDETHVIQKKLDQQFPGVKAMWVPNVLFDAVDYDTWLKRGEDIDQYCSVKATVNNAVIDTLGKDLQKIETADLQVKRNIFKKHIENTIDSSKMNGLVQQCEPDKQKLTNVLHKTVDAEIDLKETDPTKTLFFRGYRNRLDFNRQDAFYVSKDQSESDYAKTMAGENEAGRKANRQTRSVIHQGVALLSFSDRILSNISWGGECPLHYMVKDNRGFAIPVSKEKLMKRTDSSFSLGNDLDDTGNVSFKRRAPFKTGFHYHPRAKAHVSAEDPTMQIQDLSWIAGRDRKDKRVTVHKTQQEARQGYADYFKEVMNNAIPLTEPTADDIKTAKKAWNAAKEGKTFVQFKEEL